MSLRTTDEILDAVEHLPDGATLVVPQIRWDDYERLLEDLGDRSGLRVSYDRGTLEIVSPSQEHETIACLIEDLVLIYCQTFKLKLAKFGHTTWKHPRLEKGVEADACYYVRDVQRVGAPDIAVEIDITSVSLKKLSIYASLAIPEIWRCDGTLFRFYELVEGSYHEIAGSHFLPKLTASMLTESIEIKRKAGQDEAREAFLRRIQSFE